MINALSSLRSAKRRGKPENSIAIVSLALAITIAALAPVSAAPLVADISNYRIHVDSSFNGTRLFLFGARNDTGDIVVAVRGPRKNFIVRKKEEIAGVWINRDRMKFFNTPDFFALASSRPLSDITEYGLFKNLGLGDTHMLTPPSGIQDDAKVAAFSEAFLAHQAKRRLYHYNPQPISFMGEMLFKTVIDFPDNIPSGSYTAEIYLINDGEVTGMQSTPVTVQKAGLDAILTHMAHEKPFLYGITAVILALTIGWFGGRLFEKH